MADGIPPFGACGFGKVEALENDAVFHDAEAAAHAKGFFHVVGDEQAQRVGHELFQHDLQFFSGDGVKRGKGFVHEQDARRTQKGPRHAHPLRHAAGQLAGHGGKGIGRQFHHGKRPCHARGGVGAGGGQRKAQIFARREPRQKTRILKHHGAFLGTDEHPSGIGRFQPCGDAQKRGLAAARRAEKTGDAAPGKKNVGAAQNFMGTEALAHVLKKRDPVVCGNV